MRPYQNEKLKFSYLFMPDPDGALDIRIDVSGYAIPKDQYVEYLEGSTQLPSKKLADAVKLKLSPIYIPDTLL
ncbi:hypothetical protein OAB56_03095 [Gammaproteobacteria bacterium]|nr:hypothetical protein [Gammaproteobacteria bacterium]